MICGPVPGSDGVELLLGKQGPVPRRRTRNNDQVGFSKWCGTVRSMR